MDTPGKGGAVNRLGLWACRIWREEGVLAEAEGGRVGQRRLLPPPPTPLIPPHIPPRSSINGGAAASYPLPGLSKRGTQPPAALCCMLRVARKKPSPGAGTTRGGIPERRPAMHSTVWVRDRPRLGSAKTTKARPIALLA